MKVLQIVVILLVVWLDFGSRQAFAQEADSSSAYLQKAYAQPPSIARTTYLQKVLEWSIRSNNQENEIIALYQLGLDYESYQMNSKARKSYEKCIQRARKRGSENPKIHEMTFESTMQLAQMDIASGDYKAALQLLNDVPSPALLVVAPIRKNAYQRLRAQTLMMSGRESEAIKVLEEQFKWEVDNDDYFGQIETRLIRGDVYNRLQRQTEAQAEYLAALEMAKALQSSEHITRCNDKLATSFRQNDKIDSELFYRNSNVDNYKMNDNYIGVFNENNEIADAYIQSNQLEKAEQVVAENLAFSQTNLILNSSNNTNLQALQFKSEILTEQAQSYRDLAVAYDSNKNYEKAILNYRKYMAFQDSVQAIREQELELALSSNTMLEGNEKKIIDLEKDRELNEQRIQLLEQEKALNNERVLQRNIIIGVLILLVLSGLIGGYFFVRLTRSRQQSDKLVALQSLTGQMNPHFIFNALNSVNEFIGHNDERAANRYLTSFSKLMRQVMDDSRKSFIPLQEELDMLQLYLQLEHARFSDRFNYSIEVDPDMDMGAYEIPPMLLQPYIENAIWHGLRYREEFGALTIVIREQEGQLEVVITDNGIGIQRSKALKTANQRKQRSLAMRNTETRIRLIHEVYHYPIQLHIADAFEHDTYPGTRITLRCPKQHQTPDVS